MESGRLERSVLGEKKAVRAAFTTTSSLNVGDEVHAPMNYDLYMCKDIIN